MLLLSKKIVNLLLVLMLINLPVIKAGEGGVRKKLRAWNQLKNARVYLKTGQL
ncbi:uncharacterized protein METZ01_LOCUS476585, partial [marine metagenome]